MANPNPYEPPKSEEPPPARMAPSTPLASMPQGKQRGGCLTALLVLMMIANPLVALMYLATGDAIKRTLHAPDWAIPVLGVAALTNFVCAVGIWRFKKWGMFGAVAMAAVGLVVNFTIGIQPMQALMGLLGPVILIALVKPQWAQFD